MGSWTVSLVVFSTLCLGYSFPKGSRIPEKSTFKPVINGISLSKKQVKSKSVFSHHDLSDLAFPLPLHPPHFFFLYTNSSLLGPPRFFSFASPCSRTLQSSFILHINPTLPLYLRTSLFNLWRNHFPIDHVHYFCSIWFCPFSILHSLSYFSVWPLGLLCIYLTKL